MASGRSDLQRPPRRVLPADVGEVDRSLRRIRLEGNHLARAIGSDKRMEYTVIGDVVNVAPRLEAIAVLNRVLVSEATRALLGDAFPLRCLGEQNLTSRKATTLSTRYAIEQE